MKISIGITTTPNRSASFQICLNKWVEFLPAQANIFIYCDDNYTGISAAKNSVLAICGDADFYFIVDDDIMPVDYDWHLPYVNSGLNHACWNYDRKVNRYTVKVDNLGKDVAITSFDELETPNGCMLFFSKLAIDTVGGWDTEFTGYGYEHVNLSDRIFNNRLTPARYIDVPKSKELFAMLYRPSDISDSVRASSIPTNYALYQQKYYSKEFKPYRWKHYQYL